MLRLLVGHWYFDSGYIQCRLIMVMVRLLGHVLVRVDPVCDQERIGGLEDGCPDGCLCIDVGFHVYFSDFEGDVVVVESLMCIVGSRGAIVVPYRNGRFSWLPRLSRIS